MKHNYLLLSYNSTLKKYHKYFSRLQRNIKNGNFLKLSASRKNFLLRKVEKLRAKLASMQPQLVGTVAAAALFSALSLPADAQNPTFVYNTAKNPLLGGAPPTAIQSAYSWSGPAVGDLDNDGDQDVLISSGSSFYYYKNTGSNSTPAFTLQTGTDNPMGGYTAVYGYPSLVLVDMDGDADLDLLAGGANYGTGQIITYYENTGTVSSPVFTLQTGANNPLPACSGYTGYGSPAVADIDGDGDKDVFLADGKFGKMYFFQNTGSANNPVFSENTVDNPFGTGDVTPTGANNYLFPAFADIDGDGDQDAILGQKNKEIFWYKNTGTSMAPVMTLQSSMDNPFSGISLRWELPAFADLNNDGTLDLILGEENNTNIYFNSGTAMVPKFTLPMNFGQYSRIRFADIDGDSDQDAVFSGVNSPVQFLSNDGPATAPVFTAVTGTNNPFNNISSVISNAFADLDGDSDLDLATGDWNGGITYYENTGTAVAPVYTQVTGAGNPLDGLTNGGYASSLIFVDIDNDGDQDLVSGAVDNSYSTGTIVYFQNTGTSNAAVFTQQIGANNPFDAITTGPFNYLSFVNFDGDGDMDLLIGTGSNGLYYYKNTGTANAPVFTQQTGTDNPFDFINTNYSSNGMYYGPAFMDVDTDGDLDLFVAQEDGFVKLYENTTSIPTSVFAPKASSFSSAVAAYPNPVKDVLNFSLNDGIGSNMKVSILDMAGTEMLNQNFNNKGAVVSLNVSELNNGIYMLRISSDTKVSVVKFVKQ